MSRLDVGLAALLLLGGCRQERQPEPSKLGAQAGAIASDTEALREAQAAANEVIRNAQDCEAMKTGVPDAQQKLDAVAARIKTEAGRQTLQALKAQVRTIGEACP